MSKKLRPQVWMVATPIGNLEDWSPRAQRILSEVDEVWCEDTRHTQALLNASQIVPKRLRRVDQHVDLSQLKAWVGEVSEAALRIAVVTDAGTPGLSDPGAQVVQVLSSYPEVELLCLPGPSALSAFVSISGFQESSFGFLGFFPRTEKEGLEWLSRAKNAAMTRNWIWFESPNRIQDTVLLLRQWARVEEEQGHAPVRFILAKELSKIYEQQWSGEGEAFLTQWLDQKPDLRGEWIFGITLSLDYLKIQKPEAEWQLSLRCLIEAGVSVKQSSQIVSRNFEIAKNLAYSKALEISKNEKK